MTRFKFSSRIAVLFVFAAIIGLILVDGVRLGSAEKATLLAAPEQSFQQLSPVDQFGGSLMDMHKEGPLLYTITGGRLSILDVSNPTNMIEIGRDDFVPHRTFDQLAKYGNYLYLTSDKGLHIFDVSNPADPTSVNQLLPHLSFYHVKVNDALLYANTDDYMMVFNLTDPTAPVTMNEGMKSGSIDFRDQYAYVSFGAELYIYDISDPANPQEINTYEHIEYLYDIHFYGNFGYLHEINNGILILDFTDPADPQYVGNYDPVFNFDTMTIAGDYLFAGINELYILDLTTPENPSLVLQFSVPNPSIFGLVVDGNTVFANRGAVLDTLVFDGEQLMSIGQKRFVGRVNDISVEGDLVVASATADESTLIDISDANNIQSTGTVPGRGHVIANGHLYTNDFGTIRIFDIVDPANPILVATYSAEGFGIGLDSNGSHMFIVSAADELIIIDVTNPQKPQTVSSLPLEEPNDLIRAAHVTVENGVAYIVDHNEQFHVVDVSNPSAPVMLDSIPFLFEYVAHPPVIKDGYALLAASGQGLHIFDVSSPSQILQAGSYEVNALRIAIDSTFVYVATFNNLRVFYQQPDPGRLLSVGAFTPTRYELLEGVAVHNNRILTTSQGHGLYFFDQPLRLALSHQQYLPLVNR